jgi:hypothetical protein
MEETMLMGMDDEKSEAKHDCTELNAFMKEVDLRFEKLNQKIKKQAM